MEEWHDIVSGCRKGEQQAELAAYRKLWQGIYPSVYRILRHREESEDVMQESLLRGFGRLQELKDPMKYPAWQRQISVNMALNQLRKKRKESISFPAHEQELPENEGSPAFSPELARKKVEELPEGYRMVVTLHLEEQMTHEEIGQALGITASTSRSQYSRALNKLKNELLKSHGQPV